VAFAFPRYDWGVEKETWEKEELVQGCPLIMKAAARRWAEER
jgi:hypothetical protein